MSRPEDSYRPFLSFGNPFRMILPKGSYLSPKLLFPLNTFEETLAERIKKLMPRDREDVLSLSWMRFALESLCGIHIDIKTLITALELPVCDWDDKWIDVYLDNSLKLLDIFIVFTSEISRLNQGNLFLRRALHNLSDDSKKSMRVLSSLDGWRQHIRSKNPKLENCFSIMDGLAQTLDLPKIKNSAKGKVLMRAMYGVKVVTVFVCSIIAAAFSGSAKKLMDLQVPDTYLWADAFTGMQTLVNTEIRRIFIYSGGRVSVLKELEAVDASVKKLYPIVQNELDPNEAEMLQNPRSGLVKSEEKLSRGLNLLSNEVSSFFKIVLTGRDALLDNIRIGGNASDSVKTNKVEGQAVR